MVSAQEALLTEMFGGSVASFLGRFVREGLISENVNNRATPFNREGGMEFDASPLFSAGRTAW